MGCGVMDEEAIGEETNAFFESPYFIIEGLCKRLEALDYSSI